MKIVLASPPLDGFLLGPGTPPPLGLFYIATAAREKLGGKVEIKVVDACAHGLYAEEAAHRVVALAPDIFGISVLSPNINRGLRLLRLVKKLKPGVTTVLGGLHATLFDRLLLREVPEVDLVLRGEAEESFPELCRRILQGQEVAGVPGLSWRSQGEIIQGRTQVILDLDALAFPNLAFSDYQDYFTRYGYWHLHDAGKVASVLSSRGCPARCTFCSQKPAELAPWRPRSTPNVFQELRQLSQKGYKAAVFADQNFTVDPARLNQLCRLLLQNNLKMSFGFEGFLHHLPDATLALMKDAGFEFAFVGVESGSDPQRRRYRKLGSALAVAQGVQRARKHHLLVFASFIIGGPGETRDDIERTKEFIRKAQPHLIDIQTLKIYPGAELWDELVGPGEPPTLKAADSKAIYDFAGFPDPAALARQAREIYQSYVQRLWRWPNLLELVRLIKHNSLVRQFIRGAFKQPHLLLQILKTKHGK
jgi:radical SAM superfamily enzyme YgiQ (UPF0313 family)